MTRLEQSLDKLEKIRAEVQREDINDEYSTLTYDSILVITNKLNEIEDMLRVNAVNVCNKANDLISKTMEILNKTSNKELTLDEWEEDKKKLYSELREMQVSLKQSKQYPIEGFEKLIYTVTDLKERLKNTDHIDSLYNEDKRKRAVTMLKTTIIENRNLLIGLRNNLKTVTDQKVRERYINTFWDLKRATDKNIDSFVKARDCKMLEGTDLDTVYRALNNSVELCQEIYSLVYK
jgi:hypothetical protein